MKNHLPWVLCVFVVGAVGCDNQEAKRAQERRDAARRMAQEQVETRQRGRALREQLKQGLQPVIDCALERFRKEAALKYGASAVKQAKITAEASKFKASDGEKQEAFGDKWEVTIRYVGKDENGTDVDTQWVAEVDLVIDSMVCPAVTRK